MQIEQVFPCKIKSYNSTKEICGHILWGFELVLQGVQEIHFHLRTWIIERITRERDSQYAKPCFVFLHV